MLDLVPSTPEGVNDRIPMDLSQYLLAASPPSLGFDFMSLSLHASQHNLHSSQSPSPDNYQMSNAFNTNYPFYPPFSHNNCVTLNRKHVPLKPIIVCSDNYSSDSEGENTPESPQSPGRTPKKVSFADHKGLALAQVRFVKEGPDEPPLLDAKVLSLLTQGANAGISIFPPIKLCFPQPASEYMAFRDKVNNNMISLENVILEEYTVKGTIKVRNISFEKRVFVRLSLDKWLSFTEHEADYVPGLRLGFDEPIDTFSFKLDISPSFDVFIPIQFAVCFEASGNQYWDNNGGSNYHMVSDRYDPSVRPPSPPLVNLRWLPEKRQDSAWTEFSAWKDVGCSGRFY